MKKIMGGLVYNTETASCLADNYFADGSNRLQHGRGKSLYRTAKGHFFAYYETCWQGERDCLDPLRLAEARELFEELTGDADNWPAEFGEIEEA